MQKRFFLDLLFFKPRDFFYGFYSIVYPRDIRSVEKKKSHSYWGSCVYSNKHTFFKKEELRKQRLFSLEALFLKLIIIVAHNCSLKKCVKCTHPLQTIFCYEKGLFFLFNDKEREKRIQWRYRKKKKRLGNWMQEKRGEEEKC